MNALRGAWWWTQEVFLTVGVAVIVTLAILGVAVAFFLAVVRWAIGEAWNTVRRPRAQA